MKKAALVLGFIVALTVMASAQTRTATVTNFTLAKYQTARLAAERELREKYAQMGFPSPEELDRQKEADLKARLELAEQLRRARLEKERLELERRGLDIEAARLDAEIESSTVSEGYPVYIGGGLFSSGFNSFDRRRRHHRSRSFPHAGPRGAYRVTPVGVIRTGGTRPGRFFAPRPRSRGRR